MATCPKCLGPLSDGHHCRPIWIKRFRRQVGASLLGGALGIAAGRGGSYLVSVVLHWPTAVSLGAIVAAVLVSATVGIAFGFYPAWKASRLDPIEALRHE